MSKKSDFVTAMQEANTVLAKLTPKYQQLFETYFDRGYNGGGTDPLVDGDIPAELGITAADIAASITLAENIGKFFNSQEVFVSDYQATLNRTRTDL